MTLDPLKVDFTFRGHDFHQLKRSGKVALYSRISAGGKLIIGYEVIRIKDVPEKRWPNGKVTVAHEGYPGDEEFGHKGWYFVAEDEEGALKRYKSECRAAEKREKERGVA